MRWRPFVILAVIAFCQVWAAEESATPKNETSEDALRDGQVCMTVENFRAATDAEAFFECAPLSDQEVQEFKLNQGYLGIWKRRDCPAAFEFDEQKQRCVERKKLRRQQAACGTTGGPGCAAPCRANNNNPTIGGLCNWRTAQLSPDTSSGAHFLQCAVQNTAESCGEWVRMPCASGTVFNINMQICIPTGLQCGQNEAVPICPCRQAASGAQCPGRTTCSSNNVCCGGNYVIGTAVAPIAASPSNGLCIGSGAVPVGSCGQGCGNNYHCQENVGCCPGTPSGNVQPILITLSICPETGATPIGSCSSCPSGTICNRQVGGCCPNTNKAAVGKTYTAVILCPSGTPASEPCGPLNYCPNGLGCFQGACCPMVCPQGQSVQGFCNSNSCSGGSSCIGGCCCSQVKLPVCSNGQKATTSCLLNQECGNGYECSNGGCCPVPFCPSGVQATSRCLRGGCGRGQVCLDSLCCPMPKCNSGNYAVRVCSVTANCGPGYECNNGGCCPLPTCPSGVTASKRCNAGGCCCPRGQGCMNGGCCPLPTCPSGGIANNMCFAGFQCGRGSECFNGGCCPLPRCASGVQAIQRCQIGRSCPNGQMCENGVCCPMPVCSATGSVAMSVCGMGNACPVGYLCEGRGCCPEPMPLCPSGGRATQKCIRGSDCPPGFGCTPLGGCCLLSLEPVCPLRQNAVCQCSSNNGCPAQSSCNMGTCCTSAVATYNAVPGTRCQQSTQCNGFSSNCATCQNAVCVCLNGAYNNGAACIQGTPIVLNKARRGCDQYGSPCRFHLSPARRKPLFAPVGNATETPLWFNVAGERYCVMDNPDIDPDSTCLPSETCIDGKCRPKLWPGEYGCRSDTECSSRCPNTYCEAKSDKNVPQCQCRNGLLLYGRCFETCPMGFHESGAYCMHDDEEAFWENGDAQENLQSLLNDGHC
uniref:Chitin-binding type-2 domain-containing protein n=1 Tax=Panagrellus redivivus TaxID=6233 RepID=A0A7E4ZRW9_PANRE